MSSTRLQPLSFFAPPYRDFLAFDPEEGFLSRFEALWGVALVWNMDSGHGEEETKAAVHRPGGVPLIVILPPAPHIRRIRTRVLEVVEDARPQSILPFHPHPDPEEMALLLKREPEGLPEEVLEYLAWRGIRTDMETRRIIRRIVELSENIRTLAGLARGVYLSRRALGRRFRDRGLPVPSHWLQFSRILRAAIRLQNSDTSLHEVSRSLGYPDGFTLSNQMDRVVGIRPSAVRERLGWEWIVESWLRTETTAGGLEIPLLGGAGASVATYKRQGGRAAVSRDQFSGPQAVLELTDPMKSSEAERSGAAA
jgi:AraC-like DNA-binding protein